MAFASSFLYIQIFKENFKLDNDVDTTTFRIKTLKTTINENVFVVFDNYRLFICLPIVL